MEGVAKELCFWLHIAIVFAGPLLKALYFDSLLQVTAGQRLHVSVNNGSGQVQCYRLPRLVAILHVEAEHVEVDVFKSSNLE